MKWCPIIVALVFAGCHTTSALSPLVASVREVGTIPNPPGAGGRDVGFSVPFGGHSVWIFGDTFFSDAAADGYHWRASTWSWTDDRDASDGLTGWTHALGTDGKPKQLLPHTSTEQAFDDAHNGNPCPAGSDCGARHTVWPQAVVVNPASGQALVFYTEEQTEPTGAYAFHSTGTSVATWTAPDAPATRPEVAPGAADPTLLFASDEPPWGAAAFIEGTTLYAYACPGGGLSAPCRLAKVAVSDVLQRSAWRFWNGSGWVEDWHTATAVFDGAPLMTVHFNGYLQRYLAVYMVPLTGNMAIRTADHPEGPWSSEQSLGQAAPAQDGNWDYALAAHPELDQDGGRVEYLSYFQPGSFLNGVIHLLEVTFH